MTRIRLLPIMVATTCLGLAPGRLAGDVVFTGLDEAQETNARALMPLASAACDSGRWRIERLFRDADVSLAQSLQALGYYDIEFRKSLTWGPDCWQAVFDVDPGAPVRYGSVAIEFTGEAASDPAFQERVAVARPAAGETFDHGRYEAYKTALLRAADALGYFDAAFARNEVIVDRSAGTAALDLRFDSGPRYRISEINFTPGIIDERILRGYGDLRSGDYFANEPINALYDALSGSGYFDSVQISSQPADAASATVPVNVSLTPAPRRVYSVGGGFASDTGVQGRLGYTDRRRNTRGHQFESRLFASPVRSELTASYRWPRKDPRKEWFSLVAGFQHEDSDSSENDTYKLGFLYTRKLSAKWLETRYLDIAQEDFTVGGQTDSSQLVIAGVNWESVLGREVGRTRHGRRFNFDIRGASDALGSDTSFLQLRATVRWVRSFDDLTRIIARVSGGMTLKDEFSELPASVRFFAGGDRSVRGYDYESLGPLDALGRVAGGSHLLEGSLELERMVRDQWAVAAFVDSGSAFNGSNMDFSTGVGIGLRWYSPVGPVRFDIAHPLDDADRSVRLHLMLGPDL